MASVDDLFPSQWLKHGDLKGRRVTVRMSHVKVEEVGDDKKPVLYFQGTSKGLVLNVTNANMIKEVTGADDTDGWRGRQITLYVAKVDFQGKRVDSIRVDYPDNANPGTAAPTPVARPMPVPVQAASPDPFLSPEQAHATGAELTDDDLPF